MAAIQIVFSTVGTTTTFTLTSSSTPFFASGNTSVTFSATTNSTPIFASSSTSVTFTATTNSNGVFLTPSQTVSFFVTPNTTSTKLLVLKIGDLSFDTDQTYVDVPDATGVYDAVTNPGGWNPDGDPPVVGRPARDEALLWTVYRIWSRPTSAGYGENTQTPPLQNEEYDDPYVYPLTFPTETIGNDVVPIRGIYELIMMAVPLNEVYANYIGNVQLAQQAAQFPDWYVTSVGVVVDPDLINCLNRKRYEFLQGVMCGKCDDEYLYFYGLYVGLLNAMAVQDWVLANDFYVKLKDICATAASSCGC